MRLEYMNRNSRPTHFYLFPYMTDVLPSSLHLGVVETKHSRVRRLDYPAPRVKTKLFVEILQNNTHFTLSSKSSRSASRAAKVALSSKYNMSLSIPLSETSARTSFRAHISSSLSECAIFLIRRNDDCSCAAVCSEFWISCWTAW